MDVLRNEGYCPAYSCLFSMSNVSLRKLFSSPPSWRALGFPVPREAKLHICGHVFCMCDLMFFDSATCMYTHVCVYKLCAGVYRCEHMHLGAREQLCVLYYTPRYFSRQCLLLNLELANSARLADQRGPKVLLSPPTPSAGITDTYLVFLCWC